jgi:Flp pilus assembly pilin Flp
MNTKTKLISIRTKRKESGYTLLEYCAGAAVIIGVLAVALNTLGVHLSSFLGAIGSWADNKASTFSSTSSN